MSFSKPLKKNIQLSQIIGFIMFIMKSAFLGATLIFKQESPAP